MKAKKVVPFVPQPVEAEQYHKLFNMAVDASKAPLGFWDRHALAKELTYFLSLNGYRLYQVRADAMKVKVK
jgi:hypothetical protein